MPDTPETAADMPAESAAPYQVLARKYRPGHFRDLIGQEAMVQTLTNAFAHDRIAHAFALTGVRGVGKTTTARIIAKGLNCLAAERPTIDPCGKCAACVAIARGGHVDVIEMDAASNTGVDYIREINEAVRYRPAEIRYKVYIIDEVHMLSTGAFNALLKTLEEPPPHVIFILATTEIRKVPVTVLSRCQRFDLRRIEPEAMLAHLRGVTEAEGGRIDDAALGLITRAAEGSVRDALSLLDQALAFGGDGTTGAPEVRAMLGLADRGRVIDLFEAVMRGDAPAALEELASQYSDGADPGVVLRDLAELTHWVSVIKISESHAEDPTVGPEERARGRDLAQRLQMRSLTRAWQMLLKALEELSLAPNAMMAAEMAVIRLTHVADLPPPGDLVRRLREGGPAGAGGAGPAQGGPMQGGATPRSGGASSARLAALPGGVPASVPASVTASVTVSAPSPKPDEPAPMPGFATLEDIVARLREAREAQLVYEVEQHLRLVSLRPGLVEFTPARAAPEDLAPRLGQALRALTGTRWSVAISDGGTRPTIAEERRAARSEAERAIADHPVIAAIFETFPGAEIRDIRPLSAADPAGAGEFLAPAEERDEIEGDLIDTDDTSDPFEET